MTPIIEKSIEAAPAILAALISLYTVRKVQQVHISINSRFDEWMAATKKASYAEGKLAGEKKTKV
jgi:hypothetical protein